MRKVLLGMTALVAAAAFASMGTAQADEMMEGPVTVGLSGYSTGIVGFASDSDDTMRGEEVFMRGEEVFHVFEFGVSGSTTLDNGITVGVHAQLGTSGDPFDEQHITMSGSFGSLRIGRTESAAYNATVAAPGGSGIGVGVNNGWYSPAAKDVNTYSGIGAEDALKVVYTSPNFNGLNIGMSYAPDASDKDGAAGRTIGNEGDEHVAVAATYSTDFMEGGSFTLGAGYETAAGEGDAEDIEGMKLGVSVSVDQVSFGGGMYEESQGDMSTMQYDVGASIVLAMVDVGVQYAANEKGETSKTALNLTYPLGPGIVIGGQIAAGSVEGMDDVTQVLLGTSVSF